MRRCRPIPASPFLRAIPDIRRSRSLPSSRRRLTLRPVSSRQTRRPVDPMTRRSAMASVNPYSVTAPPPSPPPTPPPYRYRRSLAGPVILILIGLLFLMKNLGFRFPIWHWFGHWWPLLLILWGVIVLVENMTSTRAGYRTRHLGAGGIVLMVLLVTVGVAAHFTSDSDYDWSGVRDQLQMDDNLGGIFGTAFTFEDTLEQPFPANGTLRVVCD